MSASHQAYRHARLKGLVDDPNLLSRCPAPTALNRCDDLNSIRRIAHRHGCMPHTAKWETVSGRFGGYLKMIVAALDRAEERVMQVINAERDVLADLTRM